MSLLADFLRKNGPEVHALFTGGLPGFILSARPSKGLAGVPVFTYHAIDSGSFAKDLEFLTRNGYETLGADALLAIVQRESRPKACEVVLSCDDGAVGFYRVAYPLLKQYGMKAVLFIAPGLHRPASEVRDVGARLCSWEELEEMHSSGRVDIQSHSLEHRSMTDWPAALPLAGVDEDLLPDRTTPAGTLMDDLRTARQLIEQRFHKTVRHLAWPQYVASPQATAQALDAGYVALWTGTLPRRPLNRPGDSPRAIVRLSAEFVRRLPGESRSALGMILLRRYQKAVARKLSSLKP